MSLISRAPFPMFVYLFIYSFIYLFRFGHLPLHRLVARKQYQTNAGFYLVKLLISCRPLGSPPWLRFPWRWSWWEGESDAAARRWERRRSQVACRRPFNDRLNKCGTYGALPLPGTPPRQHTRLTFHIWQDKRRVSVFRTSSGWKCALSQRCERWIVLFLRPLAAA